MVTISLNKETSQSYIAFFDLDRTLIRTNSGKTLIKQAYKHKLLSRSDVLKGFYLSLLFRFNLREPTKIINTLFAWMRGVSVNQMNEISEELFSNHILLSIYDEVSEEINFHKSKGGKVVILSSAILPVCKIVADYLKMDDIICSRLETENGIYTGRPEGRLCFGFEKHIRLSEYCRENNINTSDSWYYGDSIADSPALNTVGVPVCINPDRKLRKEALIKGWRILNWH